MGMPKSSDDVLSGEEWMGKGMVGIVSRAKGLVVGAIGSAIGRFRTPQTSFCVAPLQVAVPQSFPSTSRLYCAIDERVAQQIMGHNFLGLDAVITKFGVHMTEQELLNYPEIPWSEDELNEVRDTHLLVAGYPLTIVEIRAKAPRTPKTFYRYEDGWYNNQRFATEERVGLGWHLIRKDIVPNSTRKTWSEQQKLISPNEEVPGACDFVYAIVLYYLVTGGRLFPSVYARCSSVDSGGSHVYVGCFDADGLRVHSRWDGHRRGSVGVASAWKSR